MVNEKLHLIDANQKLPAGTVDSSGEFFVDANEVHCRTEGKTYSFNDFPERVKAIVSSDMDNNPEKIDCLIDWGLEDGPSQMRQYIFCLYGGHDTTADFNADGEMQPSEYVNCGRRNGICKYEGTLCNSLSLANGILSKSEIEVLKCIAVGDFDDEIADKLNISKHTLRHHKDSISKKSGLERKPALVGLAYKIGLIHA